MPDAHSSHAMLCAELANLREQLRLEIAEKKRFQARAAATSQKLTEVLVARDAAENRAKRAEAGLLAFVTLIEGT